MAEATGLRNNVLDYPIYALPYTVVFPILDADGDLVTGAASLDSEVSKNGDSFADCSNEATEIASSSGMYYLTLTATEMTADIVAIIVKTSTTGAKTTPIVLYPKKLAKLRSDTAQGGDSGYITLDASASAVDDYYNGCVVVTTGGTGSGQARVVSNYTGSNKHADVTPNWATSPDATTTFDIYLTETAWNAILSNVTHWNGTAIPGVDTAGYPKVTVKDGTGTGELNTTDGKVSIYRPTGSVVADAGNTSTTFKTDLTGGNDAYNRQWLKFISGSLAGEVSKVSDFDGGTDFITVASGFTATPSDGDDFELINE